MADEPAGRTSLGVLHEILTNLGDSNTYITVVDALEALLNVLGSGGIGQAVSDWLEAHPEASTTVQNGSITLLKLANDVKTAIDGKAASSDLQTLADNLEALAQTVAEKADASDLDDKADIDGYYSQLTAGLAENLIGRGDAVPAEYLYRTAGGTADIEDGIATIRNIKGNALVRNQLIPALDSNWGVYGVADATFDTTNNSVMLKTAETGGQSVCRVYNTSAKTIVGHKYYMSCVIDTSMLTSPYTAVAGMHTSNGNGVGIEPRLIIDGGKAKARYSLVLESSQEGGFGLGISFAAPNDQYAVFQNPQLFDLTLMFGAGNEPSTVEEFEAMFPKAYYPYSAPKLLPVDIRGVETVGFNLWDEAWEGGGIDDNGDNVGHSNQIRSKNYIPVFPGTTYYIYSGNETNEATGIVPYYYDGSKHFISRESANRKNTTITTPDGCRFMRFKMGSNSNPVTTYQNDICINLVWSGYRNGEYEEHWSAERPIDTSHYFPTGMKKAGDKADALYADHYDTVIGSVDLGTLTWSKYGPNSNTGAYFYGTDSLANAIAHAASNSVVGNITAAAYPTNSYNQLYSGTTNGVAVSPSGRVLFYDSAFDSQESTKEAFKAAMSGVILYYELDTPTTTPIDPPLNLSYKVSDFGTERIMVDETADAPQTAPVPMEVEYGINAIDTIRRLPTEYQSHKSMGQLTAALESSLGIDITETWDEDDQRYEYEATPFELADDSIPDAKLAQTGGILSEVATLGFLGDKNLIPVNTNVNDLPDGVWYSDYSSRTNSLVNCPVKSTNVKFITFTRYSTYKVQFAICGNGRLYFRTNSGGGWAAWKEMGNDIEQLKILPSAGVSPSYGSDLCPSLSTFTGSDATWDGSKWVFADGGSIESSVTVEADKVYLVNLTATNPYTGADANGVPAYLTVTLGNDSVTFFAANDAYWYVALKPTAGGSVTFSVQSVNHWTGNITGITVKEVTGYAPSLLQLYNQHLRFITGNNLTLGGLTTLAVGEQNTSFGRDAQVSVQAGRWNTALGAYAQRTLRNGTGNTAVGVSSQANIESGCYNNALGNATQTKITTGNWNNAVGNEAQLELTTGCNNVNIGRRSGTAMRTGNFNTHVGTWTGFTGINPQQGVDDNRNTISASFQTLVGGKARQIDSQSDYLIAIGYDAQGDEKAVAIGATAKAAGERSIAIGYGVETSADDEVAIGSSGQTITLCGKTLTFNQDGTVTWTDATA